MLGSQLLPLPVSLDSTCSLSAIDRSSYHHSVSRLYALGKLSVACAQHVFPSTILTSSHSYSNSLFVMLNQRVVLNQASANVHLHSGSNELSQRNAAGVDFGTHNDNRQRRSQNQPDAVFIRVDKTTKHDADKVPTYDSHFGTSSFVFTCSLAHSLQHYGISLRNVKVTAVLRVACHDHCSDRFPSQLLDVE